VFVGVPVAAVVAALRVFVWVIVSLPEMVVTAAVLGAVHDLWLHLVDRLKQEFAEFGSAQFRATFWACWDSRPYFPALTLSRTN